MKVLYTLVVLLTVTFFFTSCQKELNFDPVGVSEGTMKSEVNGDCFPVTLYGVYHADSILNVTHFIDVQVNDTITGTYSIVTDTVNGYSFKGTGTFTTLGLKTVRLYGTGKPIAGGSDLFTVMYGNSTCEFNVIVVASGTGIAGYALGGAPGSCTGVVMAGTYQPGIALTASNTALINVHVTSAGNYTITSDIVNGVSFSSSGVFSIGNSSVTLTGTGIPLAAGVFNYKIFGITDTCSFSVTFAAPTPAVFTLSGAPGSCTPATVNGVYTIGQALDIFNTVTIQVDVVSPGTYTISTNTVNGINFSASGTFTVTGTQNVTLTGTGTPAAVMLTTLTPQAGTSSCTFDVHVGDPGVLTCKIDGVFRSFNDNAVGIFYLTGTEIIIQGYVLQAGSSEEFFLQLDGNGLAIPMVITPGVYVNPLTSPSQFYPTGSYISPTGIQWITDNITTSTVPDPFTITVTTLTATRATGTFSGTITLNVGTDQKIITEGIFDVPMQ